MVIGSDVARAAEAELVLLLIRHAPAMPFTGAVWLDATFYLPMPKGFTKTENVMAREGRLRPISTATWTAGMR